MSKYSTTQYNRWTSARAALQDIYSSARSFRSPADLLTRRLIATTEKHYPKLTGYYRGKYDGMQEALSNQLWRELRWQLYLDGNRVTSGEISAIADVEERKGASRIDTWRRVQGRHEWPTGEAYGSMSYTLSRK